MAVLHTLLRITCWGCVRCRCRSRGEEEFVSSFPTGKKAYDTSHAFRLSQARIYERMLIVLLFQANLTDGLQDSSEFMVAVPALKQLATMDSMELSDFLKLLSMNRELLKTLVKCDIVSTAAGIVRFQSRAAKWYAESLPAASSLGRGTTKRMLERLRVQQAAAGTKGDD